MTKHFVFMIGILVFIFGCTTKKEKRLFQYVDVSTTQIDFQNTITENDSINVINFQYCYNGGGVGIGDFNNDDLPDLVFTGNQVSSKVYLNLGELKFQDISEIADFSTNTWITGVSIVDINADGWDDIYLNVGGANCQNNCPNLLFVNQGLNSNGIPLFEEKAAQYGLDDGHYAQQTAFFDYDKDGDLDAYIVHNGNTKFDKNTPVPKRYMPKHLTDYLLRNDVVKGKGHPVFTNVSEAAGITHQGFGLGIGLNDFNNDNTVDVYISNDFITEDLLYLNTKTDSTNFFMEQSQVLMAHETYNAMGVDIADINNDALPDVLVLDMLPIDYQRQKKMLGMMNYDKYLLSKSNGYATQYMHNTLQLHNGFLGNQPLKHSEVGFMSGISSTDWSWAPLMVDFDNDGDKDIYITNGYVKDITDLDFINYSSQNNVFGTPEARNKKLQKMVADIPGIYLPNFFYENMGETNFQEISDIWTTATPSFSNGAAYADLDRDGDLDLVVNNINAHAFVIENLTTAHLENHYLQLQLQGSPKNSKAIGAKVTLWDKGEVQQHFQSVIRGYLSSVAPIVHFGVPSETVDSIQVEWPNGRVEKQRNIATDQRIRLHQDASSEMIEEKNIATPMFTQEKELLQYSHKENPSNDYVHQRLLMRQYSKLGPCIAAANINGLPGDEIFIGGSKGFPGTIWSQNNEGNFREIQSLDARYEDANAIFVDIDGDGDMDLYVASGGNEFESDTEEYQDRIYYNDGNGKLTLVEEALPSLKQSNGCIKPVDIDHDGDMDFFVGNRITPRNYPGIPESKILINENGKFHEQKNTEISQIGMVTDGVWEDIDNDGWEDLIVVGEWMPVSLFKNHKGVLRKMKVRWQDAMKNTVTTFGWWNCIAAADMDGDGDTDFIVGNQGLNGFVKASEYAPVHLYIKDFDNNGSLDPILGQYFDTTSGEKLLPVHTRDDIMLQLVSLKADFLTYEAFSKVTFKELLKIKDLDIETLKATTFATSYIENLGDATFKITPLEKAYQVAPIHNILIEDYNEDGFMDALMVGNDYSSETHYGRFDALTGLLLQGSATGDFKMIPSKESGFYVPGQSHHIISISTKTGERSVVATQNNDQAVIYTLTKSRKK